MGNTQDNAKPVETSLSVFKSFAEIVDINAPQIKEKSKLAIAALSQIKAIPVEDEELDKKANNVLVKCNATVKVIEDLRKAYTGKVNAWLDEQITPENELKKEMARVKLLRDQRANAIAAKAKEAAAQIEKDRVYKIHEGEVKNKMKAGVETGVARYVIAFEKTVADLFKLMTLTNSEAVKKKMDITPKLKEEAFVDMLNVPYDKSIMTAEQFEGLKNRAKEYFDYTKINAEYVKTTVGILDKWKANIAPRLVELKKIADGDELVARQAAERQRAEQEEREQQAAETIKVIEDNAHAATQEETMQAEFNAQVQTQEIAELSGVRNKISLRLAPDVEKDMMKIAKFIQKAVIHVLSNPELKGIYKRDAQGFPKHDEKGQALYVDGIQWWLTQLEKTGYASMIEGVLKTEEVATVAKAK